MHYQSYSEKEKKQQELTRSKTSMENDIFKKNFYKKMDGPELALGLHENGNEQ